MAAHAAALCKQVATEIQRFRSLRDTIARVTLLATGLCVFFFEHGPEPETMTSVTLYFACRCTTVAPVTTGTTKFFWIVYLKNLFIRVTDKGARPGIRLSIWSTRSHTRRSSIERVAYGGGTDFTTIADVVSIHPHLMAADPVPITGHLRLQTFDARRTKT